MMIQYTHSDNEDDDTVMMMMIQYTHSDDEDDDAVMMMQLTHYHNTIAAHLPLRSSVLHVTDITHPAIASIYPLHVEVHIGSAPRAPRRQL